ncbi:MAG: hypothetical protein JNL11_14780 [Bdellovibrionaceae bacterium]|nr:hypothetical protein [Pseudobdellovibrionaceae bacterium]
MKVHKKKEDNKNAFLIGIFFLISSVFFGVYVSSEDHLSIKEGQTDFSSITQSNQLDQINDHLKTTNDKMELQKLKALVANLKVEHELTKSENLKSQYEAKEPIINFDEDPRERRLAEDLGRTNQLKKVPLDPRSQVYNSVLEDRQAHKRQEEERRRQAQKFVADARKDGWVVRLDDKHQIKSYRRIDSSEEVDPENIDYRGFSVVPK